VSKPVVLRPAADRDLDAIVAFLRKDSRQAALRFTEAIAATARLLGDHPGVGSTRHAEICHEMTAPLRFHPVPGFERILAYYVERADMVEIIRIWDAARGLEALENDLKDDPPSVREMPQRYRMTGSRGLSNPSAAPPGRT
jgi:toxin ParE1/3/4